jgi:hypothetical protein
VYILCVKIGHNCVTTKPVVKLTGTQDCWGYAQAMLPHGTKVHVKQNGVGECEGCHG